MSNKHKQTYIVEKLVSNLPNVAKNQDVNLVNSWGLIVAHDTLWVSDNGTGLITHYDLRGTTISPATITVLPSATSATGIGTPTGIVFNNTKGFVIPANVIGITTRASSILIVCTEDGTINAWSPLINPTTALIVVDNSSQSSVYKGLALANNNIYVADFFNNAIDAFDFNFNTLAFFPPAFVDQDVANPIPSNFAPFNVALIQGLLYVAYAQQLAPGNNVDQPGPGNGYISIFNPDGTFIRRFASQGPLNSPWGMVVAPKHFGKFGGKILVGNKGDGRINVYDFDGRHLGALKSKCDRRITLDGLWGLAKHGHSVYFASGPDAETNGLVGKIKPSGKCICKCEGDCSKDQSCECFGGCSVKCSCKCQNKCSCVCSEDCLGDCLCECSSC